MTVSGAVVGTGTTGNARPDVAAVFPAYGVDTGYRIDETASAGYHTVCAYGDNSALGLPDTLLGCHGVTVPGATSQGSPHGNLERVASGPGAIGVGGWALDSASSGPVNVDFYVDGRFWARDPASDDRPDVGKVFPAAGSAHGFNVTLTGFLGGTHQVCAFVIDGNNPNIGCKNVALPGGNPFGSLDVAQGLPGAIHVGGWAIDRDTPKPATVHVYVDGRWAGLSAAGQSRPDVGAAFPGYGDTHGYSITVPVATGGGTHQVCVYAINVGQGNTNPRLACRYVTLPTGKPFGSLDVATGQSGAVHVAGWAIDPDTTSAINVHFYVDGVWTAMTTANTDRPDVGAAFAGYGVAHGYDLSIRVPAGKHTVCAYAINIGPNAGNPLLRCLAFTSS